MIFNLKYGYEVIYSTSRRGGFNPSCELLRQQGRKGLDRWRWFKTNDAEYSYGYVFYSSMERNPIEIFKMREYVENND